MAAIASATSRVSIGDVRPAPKGSRIVESLAMDSAAQAEKKKCWRKTVARTGTPDQFNTCSPNQCCRCCGESVISVRLIWDTVICEILTNTSRSLRSRATAAAVDCGLQILRGYAHAEKYALA